MTTIHIDIKNKIFPASGCTHTVIENLHCTLTHEQLICLVGPSGCGKSTLLNIVAGLDQDFSGAVSLSEQSCKPIIGYVFQNPRLLPWKTVRENIEIVLTPEHDSAQVDLLLLTLGLSKAQNTYPQQLSLGMSRRVALARAFAVQADLLLMDEPFVSLDSATARRIRALLSELRQQRPQTILFVTHDLREAIELADRLLFLSASPCCIVEDIPVNLSCQQRQDEAVIDDYRKKLMSQYPALQKQL